jgi:N-acetylmuramoyl-L-alanine amidase
VIALALAAVSLHVVWKPIPFGPERRAETATYAQRHYGVRSWVLRPKVIVEHVTATNSFSSVWSAFAANRPDPELGQLPGTCAHYVIDRDGTIYQLVPVNVICRHTVGLNHVAIGIEHVGVSDAQVLANAAQMRASLWLTRRLMRRFHIALRNVIGHNESLTSPFHKELYAPWRRQTHGDWVRSDMRSYRARLSSS